MDPVMILLRTFHILGGALWFGSAFLFAGFFGPAAAELGPAAGPVMSNVVNKRRIAKVIAGLAITTVTAGWILWLKNGLAYPSIVDWLTSPFGLVLTIGGVLATFAAYYGITGIGNNVERAVELGDQIAASGGPPTSEQGARLAHLGAEIEKHSKIDLVLLFAAVFAMATARYW
jgi:ribose/xylose/arabinose/galactoside ABC-type transport system permease subunit